jgi:type I restriction enzyme S subunit
VKSQFIEMFGSISESVMLGEISEIRNGGTPTRQKPEYYKGLIPWITTVALGANYIDDRQAMETITEEAITNSATKLIPENSLLFGIRVGIGKCSVNTVPMCTNQDIVGIAGLATSGYDPLYIKKVLETYEEFFNEQKRGATIKGITTDLLRKSAVPKAPLPLQIRFADFVRQADKSTIFQRRR